MINRKDNVARDRHAMNTCLQAHRHGIRREGLPTRGETGNGLGDLKNDNVRSPLAAELENRKDDFVS